jgi:hypothetical protein
MSFLGYIYRVFSMEGSLIDKQKLLTLGVEDEILSKVLRLVGCIEPARYIATKLIGPIQMHSIVHATIEHLEHPRTWMLYHGHSQDPKIPTRKAVATAIAGGFVKAKLLDAGAVDYTEIELIPLAQAIVLVARQMAPRNPTLP